MKPIGRVPDALIQKMQADVDIVAIIGKHTSLKKRGNEFVGCCPFHQEKTPSFSVNPQKNMYHCYGCGKGGNAITFLMEYEKHDFVSALRFLADATGHELPTRNDDARYTYTRTPTAQNTAQQNQAYSPIATCANNIDNNNINNNNVNTHSANAQGDLFSLAVAVARHYRAKMQEYGKMEYFLSRGLHATTIARFGLGYAPPTNSLCADFRGDLEGLLALGLVKRGDDGQLYDLFRERAMFAIFSPSGQVVGFGGRALNDHPAKYMNSPESILFKKSELLYGEYQARRARADTRIVVEGYMDVLMMHQAGFCGAVAPMGTALDGAQIETLWRRVDDIIMCFDGDSAGQKAAERSLAQALTVIEPNKTLKFLTLPNNDDPDSFINHHGADAMAKALNNATPLSDFLYALAKQKHPQETPEARASAMAFVQECSYLVKKNNPLGFALRQGAGQALFSRHAKPLDITPSQQVLSLPMQATFLLVYAPYLLANLDDFCAQTHSERTFFNAILPLNLLQKLNARYQSKSFLAWRYHYLALNAKGAWTVFLASAQHLDDKALQAWFIQILAQIVRDDIKKSIPTLGIQDLRHARTRLNQIEALLPTMGDGIMGDGIA